MDYFIADTHFFHENVIRFDKRPFTSVEEMNAKMRDWWNNTVRTNDRVYILGDFLWLDPREQEREYIDFTKSYLILSDYIMSPEFSAKPNSSRSFSEAPHPPLHEPLHLSVRYLTDQIL